jgi:hypothetical protein
MIFFFFFVLPLCWAWPTNKENKQVCELTEAEASQNQYFSPLMQK